MLHARQLTRPVAVAKTGVSRFARWVDDELAMFIQPNLSYPLNSGNHEAGRALCCCGLSSPLATCAAARGHGSVRTKRGVGRPCRSALPRLLPGHPRPTIPWSTPGARGAGETRQTTGARTGEKTVVAPARTTRRVPVSAASSVYNRKRQEIRSPSYRSRRAFVAQTRTRYGARTHAPRGDLTRRVVRSRRRDRTRRFSRPRARGSSPVSPVG